MPNTKNDDSNSINQNDKTTLHGAGVDLSDTPVEPEGAPEKILDIDGATPDVNDADLQKSGVKFVTENVAKTDLSTLAEKKMKSESIATKDLEAEFRSELADFKGPLKPDVEKSIIEKGGSLKSMLNRIQEKLGLKKKTVKTELESLKKMKDSITKDIGEIKELEESETKINQEIEKIESIKKEVEEIERDVAEDLKK
jgi:hypothetical protein